MAKQERDLAKEAHWRDVFQQFAASGLSVRGFCRREALGEINFYAWRRTLALRRNPLHDIPRHLLLARIIKPRHARIGMTE
jgi:hypothetical protein